jgi:hypothetical protein
VTVKIRLMGTLEECLDAQEGLNRVFDVLEVSGPYPNRGKSRLCRLYAEVDPAPARRAGRERPERGQPQDGGPGDVTTGHGLERPSTGRAGNCPLPDVLQDHEAPPDLPSGGASSSPARCALAKTRTISPASSTLIRDTTVDYLVSAE